MLKAALLILLVGVPSLGASAWGQAAVEYGMAASKSGVAAARVGSSLGKLTEDTGARVSKSLDEVMRENRQSLELKSQKSGGMLKVTSVPENATLVIDGAIVARTPAELHVSAGTHAIEVRRPVYLTWRKQVTVGEGQALSLQPKLQEKYASTVTLGPSQ
jgi:hypothetical protein